MEGSNSGLAQPTLPETRYIRFIDTKSEVTTGKSQTSALTSRPPGL